jgi:hypothetical protein
METQRSVDYFERQYSWFPLAKLYLAPTPQAQAMLRRWANTCRSARKTVDLARVFDFDRPGAAVDWQDARRRTRIPSARRQPAAMARWSRRSSGSGMKQINLYQAAVPSAQHRLAGARWR